MPSGYYIDPHILEDQAEVRIKQEYLTLFFLVLAVALLKCHIAATQYLVYDVKYSMHLRKSTALRTLEAT